LFCETNFKNLGFINPSNLTFCRNLFIANLFLSEFLGLGAVLTKRP
jgi:hypothetical protein